MEKRNKYRFTHFLRENFDVLCPMSFNGINLYESRFPLFDESSGTFRSVDAAELIYLVHRNTHAHGDELLPGYGLLSDASQNAGTTNLVFDGDAIALSDRVIFGLLACAVLAPVNHDKAIADESFEPYITWSNFRFPIDEWWGRKSDFLQIVKPAMVPGVTMDFSEWVRVRQAKLDTAM